MEIELKNIFNLDSLKLTCQILEIVFNFMNVIDLYLIIN
jgi:hypothetical protein